MSHEKPNVLVIQPDQHRGTVMGCAGDSQVKTPNLDRLASEGIRFSRCASSSPVCSPFRGTMQTGLYCHTHGVDVNNILLDPELITFADLFADAGYATGYIGKWHLDGGKPRGGGGFIESGPRRAGWQEWHGYQKGHEFFEVWDYNENRERVQIEGYDWEPMWHTIWLWTLQNEIATLVVPGSTIWDMARRTSPNSARRSIWICTILIPLNCQTM